MFVSFSTYRRLIRFHDLFCFLSREVIKITVKEKRTLSRVFANNSQFMLQLGRPFIIHTGCLFVFSNSHSFCLISISCLKIAQWIVVILLEYIYWNLFITLLFCELDLMLTSYNNTLIGNLQVIAVMIWLHLIFFLQVNFRVTMLSSWVEVVHISLGIFEEVAKWFEEGWLEVEGISSLSSTLT